MRFYSIKPEEVLRDGGTHTCALCLAYSNNKTCPGCPITDEDTWDCIDTPYGDYIIAVEQKNSTQAALCARQELEFLIRRLQDFPEVHQMVRELLEESQV